MLIERRKPLTARIGLLGVGLDTYWAQFAGLREELGNKLAATQRKIEALRAEVCNFGLIDNAEAAYAALPQIKAADVDILMIDMLTYATSSTFGVLIRDLKMPVILVALQPLAALDYTRANTYMQLCNDDVCAVPEFTGVAVRMGAHVADLIIGTRDNDPQADRQLAQWCSIACVLHDLRRARIGHMGHVLEAMLDMHTDPTAVTAAFGTHVVQCEADAVFAHYEPLDAQDRQVQAMQERILGFFDTPDPVSDPLTTKLTPSDLLTAARAAVALERFIQEKKLDGLAYYYEARPESALRELVTNFIVGNSLLTSAGFPMCGEYDLKTCLAMLIMDRLEAGGSFAEFHPVDFARDSVLIGHDGPHHLNIAQSKPVIRSLKKYHGKPGSGAGVEFNIKVGPITILSIGVQADGRFKLIIAEGESVAGPIPPTGNTNTHGRFAPDVRTFLRDWCMQGPTHHFALGIGHHADTLTKIGKALNIESTVVTAFRSCVRTGSSA